MKRSVVFAAALAALLAYFASGEIAPGQGQTASQGRLMPTRCMAARRYRYSATNSRPRDFAQAAAVPAHAIADRAATVTVANAATTAATVATIAITAATAVAAIPGGIAAASAAAILAGSSPPTTSTSAPTSANPSPTSKRDEQSCRSFRHRPRTELSARIVVPLWRRLPARLLRRRTSLHVHAAEQQRRGHRAGRVRWCPTK